MTVMKDIYINRKLYESIVAFDESEEARDYYYGVNDIKNGDLEIFRISVFDINGYSIFNKLTSC
jgi:hypothetical protein